MQQSIKDQDKGSGPGFKIYVLWKLDISSRV